MKTKNEKFDKLSEQEALNKLLLESIQYKNPDKYRAKIPRYK